ncbi:dUTP diphosphatase [Bacillus sonorensis]|uniref:dUTP diphosphatase n=1 Tax=Bacillus sonorensis TaxID=119858 RepID=UPI002DB62F57|nr:dUTP diphosphatase [Bacillus sonorensis]MEC1440550.1 dUTP diphosphatase [Bacillus sonorensis]
MRLTKLFEIQRKLDRRIVVEKGLERQDLLWNKILALQVELAELAQEVQDEWKFWKTNFRRCSGKILEEYCDCLHFVLSIGIEHGFDKHADGLAIDPIECPNMVFQISELMQCHWYLYEEGDGGNYHEGFELFLGLGKMLGFTWEEVEKAYLEKNKINHKRQDQGY